MSFDTLLSAILESIPLGIAMVDTQGRYQYVNPCFTRITGYTLADIPTKADWFRNAYPDPVYRELAARAWKSDIHGDLDNHTREFWIHCRNGDRKYIEFRSSFLPEQKISVLTDITSRVESDKVRREKDRLQGVLELSGAICHEMNQPLMAIAGYFDLIQMDMTPEHPGFAHITKIEAQLQRIADITRKLMKITHYQTKDYLNGKILDLTESSPGFTPEDKTTQ